MIEKIKAVNNPLTIIAIFAALAEVAGTVALKLVSQELQVTFIWFVMLFPVLIVILFFITLNFNPKVLYAPSDFQNEENFLSTIYGVDRLSIDLEEVQQQLEVAKTQIINDAVKQVGSASEHERARLEQIVNSRIKIVEDRVESTKESAEGIASEYVRTPLPTSIERIMRVLRDNEPQTLYEIASRAGLAPATAKVVLARLMEQGKVIGSENRPRQYRLLQSKPDA